MKPLLSLLTAILLPLSQCARVPVARSSPSLHTLTITTDGYGSTSPAGDTLVEEGDTVWVSAAPAPGRCFAHWSTTSGDFTIADAERANTGIIVGTNDLALRANFTEATHSYRFSIHKPESHAVNVVLSVKGCSTATTCFTLPKEIGLDSLIAEFSGEQLSVSRRGDTCRVANGSHSEFSVSYRLQMNQRLSGWGGYAGYVDEAYLLTASQWSLLKPRNRPGQTYSITFAVPSGWEVVAPWEGRDGTFGETDYDRFYEATFAAGTFDLREKLIGSTRVRIAIDSRHSNGFREQHFANAYYIFEHLHHLFGAEGPAEHLTVLARPTGLDQWQFVNEHALSHGEAVEDLNSACYQHAHRVFHTFNAFHPTGIDFADMWITEGVNEYYGCILRMHCRTEKPMASLKRKYQRYLEGKAALDGPIGGSYHALSGTGPEYFRAYVKGALVSMLLDIEIREITGGKKSLDDMHAPLYAQFGEHNGTCTEEDILTVLNDVTGNDMQSFFDTYIHATTPLNLSAYFTDPDNDGLMNIAEVLSGTNKQAWDTDGDGASDGYEYMKRADPRQGNSAPEDEVFTDGFVDDWSGFDPVVVSDQTGDGTTDMDIATVSGFIREEVLYVRVTFHVGILDSGYICFLDINNIGELKPDWQLAIGSNGYAGISRFEPDNTTSPSRLLDGDSGEEAAWERCAEFRVPLARIGAADTVGIEAGVWDSANEKRLDWVSITVP